MENNSTNDLDALMEIIASLKRLNKEDQKRTLQAVATFLNISFHSNGDSSVVSVPRSTATAPSLKPTFSEDRSISPKDFIREKAPRTDVERVICLAYYLTHYRETPHFKTLDISTLNTEAAQPKFSSASVAVDNAAKAGFLVQAVKGAKQISSVGELYVQHLPDRDAARQGVQGIRPKRKAKKPQARKTTSPQQ